MSKVFYDRLLALDKVEKEISKIAQSKEEKEDLYKLVDEYIHHRMMECILDKVPREHHQKFLTQFSESPHHDGLWDLLKEVVSEDIENFLRHEAFKIGVELLAIIKPKPSR